MDDLAACMLLTYAFVALNEMMEPLKMGWIQNYKLTEFKVPRNK